MRKGNERRNGRLGKGSEGGCEGDGKEGKNEDRRGESSERVRVVADL